MVSVDRRARLVAVLALVAALIFPVQAQQAKLPDILSDPATAAANPLPDFSYAGYGFGLAPIPADPGPIVDVTDHGRSAERRGGKACVSTCRPRWAPNHLKKQK